MFSFIRDKFFWRDKYCSECGSWQSTSNNSPCRVCRKGDLATQLVKNEKEYWDKIESRMERW